MTQRARAIAAATVAGMLVLAGCGGGDAKGGDGGGAKAAGGKSGTPGGDPSPDPAFGSAAPKGGQSGGRPLPKITPAQVRTLVGTWVSSGPAKDYFVFKADGSGAWMTGGRALWSGQVIPESGRRYRFSWQGSDPAQASYWGVTLAEDGKKLTFGGTSQTYTKKAAKTTAKPTTKKT